MVYFNPSSHKQEIAPVVHLHTQHQHANAKVLKHKHTESSNLWCAFVGLPIKLINDLSLWSLLKATLAILENESIISSGNKVIFEKHPLFNCAYNLIDPVNITTGATSILILQIRR